MRKRGVRIVLALVWLAALLAGAGAWWIWQPIGMRQPTLEVAIEPGQSPREVARAWTDAGLQTSPWLLYQWFRLSGQARLIRAGNYEINQAVSPHGLLAKLVAGDETLARVRFGEGWTFRQMRDELARTQTLRPDTAALSDQAIMARLGVEGQSPEGRFYPDTYAFAKGSSDLAVLARAQRAMQHHLQRVWAQRRQDLPLKTPEDVLALASIVEKETGRAADRPHVAAVFINRLRLGMPLQTDPTVIYGLGSAFDGNLRKADLLRDSPYNTYLRGGLPPTPIAMPSEASLWAAVQPSASKALYFVARGDGSSEFSETLADHNRAVNRFQRKAAP